MDCNVKVFFASLLKKQQYLFQLYFQIFWTDSLIEAEWHIYAVLNQAIINSDNGLSHIW